MAAEGDGAGTREITKHETREALLAAAREAFAKEVRDEKVRAARLQSLRRVRARQLRANPDFATLLDRPELTKILGTRSTDR